MKHEVTSLNTKRTLSESLKKLMKTKSFSKITVSEIIEECGLNRKTFYYHFEDKYDLLKWMFENEAIEVVRKFDLIVDYEEALIFIMDYIDENDYILNCAFDSIGQDELKRFFFRDFIEITASVIDSAEKSKGIMLDSEYKEFLCIFYTDALAGILMDWIRNRKYRNRDKIIEYLKKTMKISIEGILDNEL